MNATTSAVDEQHRNNMPIVHDALAAASSAMSPPTTMSSLPNRPQHLTPAIAGGSTTMQSPSTRHPHRRVRFNDQISGVIVPCLDDVSIKERHNIWYNSHDKAQLRENLKNNAIHMRRCMSSSVSSESDETTSRGIEHLASGAHLRNLDAAKTAVVRAVLLEQYHQRAAYGGDVTDDFRLALASSELSLEARKRALVMAASDQEFVLCDQQMDHHHHHHHQQQKQMHISSKGLQQMLLP